MADSPTSKGRRFTFLYILSMMVLVAACSLLQWVDRYLADMFFYISFGLSLLLGWLHISFGDRYLGKGSHLRFGSGLLAAIGIVLLGSVVGAVAYYFLKLHYYFLFAGIGFVLPFFIAHTYWLFTQIPVSHFKLWFYPIDEQMPDLDMIELSEIEVVQFVFNKTPTDEKQTSFTSKAPLNMTLGQLFFIFINDYNERNARQPIAFLEGESQPFGWFFYKETGWFKKKRLYDPELSFRDNAIAANQTIYAIRAPYSQPQDSPVTAPGNGVV